MTPLSRSIRPGKALASPADGAGDRRGQKPTSPAARRWVVYLLGACILFYVVNNGIWLLNDASSPSYDTAAHAGLALQYLRLFEARG